MIADFQERSSETISVELRSSIRRAAPIIEEPRARVGALVISLDFELHWGVRDRVRLDRAERIRLMAARAGIPRILELFHEFSVHATWATVGLLFARTREEALAFRPRRRPAYQSAGLDPYREPLGNDESDDPFHFAPSLIAKIAKQEGQEIASHSFSHYYAMEAGQTLADFEADLSSATAIAANSGYTLRSYAFPRNQVNPAYLPALSRAGIMAYRGTEATKAKRPGPFTAQRNPFCRMVRLLDSYLNFDGHLTYAWPNHASASVPASRYLRSYRAGLRPLEPWHIRRIVNAMGHAARQGEIFHLWWHPEDFATNCDANLRLLRQLLEAWDSNRARHGMLSLSMAEALSRAAQSTAPQRAS